MISFQLDGDVVDPAAEEVVAGEAEGVEFGRERVGVGEIRFLAREPDQPARLDIRQLLQMMVGLVEPGEAVRPRHAGERAVGGVGPGVIGADDARAFAHVAALDQPRAAMAADVPEDVGDALLVAGQQQGMPKPSCATAMLGSGSSAEGAITCGSRSNSLRLLARRSGPDRYRPRPARW